VETRGITTYIQLGRHSHAKRLLGMTAAIALTLGTYGPALAVTPDATIAAVRNSFTYVDQPIVDDDSLSNQPINDPSD
jgi:hypothetical protein